MNYSVVLDLKGNILEKLKLVDVKLREEISKDAFACLAIFQSEEVQKDITDFFTIISRQMGITKSEEETIQE